MKTHRSFRDNDIFPVIPEFSMCPLHGENVRDPDLSAIEEINSPTKFSVSRNFSRAPSRGGNIRDLSQKTLCAIDAATPVSALDT